MINMIAAWIKEFILSFLRKSMYNSKKRKLEKEINERRKEIEKVNKDVTRQRNDFKFKLQQYRTSTNGDVRRSIERLRDISRKPGSRDKVTSKSDSDPEQPDKGKPEGDSAS